MASLEPTLRRQRIFELTQISLDTFKERLRESSPLSSGKENAAAKFYEEPQILLAAEVAKSEVIAEFKNKLETEDSIAVRVESLEILLDTILHEYLKENLAIQNAAERTIVSHVESLVVCFTRELDEFQKANTLTENGKLESYHEKLKADIVDSWNKLEKPDYPNFVNKFKNDFMMKLNEISSIRMCKYQKNLEKIRESAEAEIEKLVKQFEDELTARIGEFDINMTSEWNSFASKLQEKSQEGFVREEKNPFPVDHSQHDILNEKLAKTLNIIRKTVGKSRFGKLYPVAVHQCLVNYLVSMEEHLFGVNYMRLLNLHQFHETSKRQALDQWNLLGLEGDKALEFMGHLLDKINQALALFEKQVESVNEKARQTAKRLVRACQKDYESRMRQQIEGLHKQYANHALEMLKSKNLVKKDEDFVRIYEGELEGYLAEKFEDYMKILKGNEEAETFGYDGTHVNTSSCSIKDGADVSGEPVSETQIFENLYRKQVSEYKSYTGLQEITEVTFQMFSGIQIAAFKKLCLLKGRENSEGLISKLRAQLVRIRQAEELNLKNQATIKNIIAKMEDDFKVKAEESLKKYPAGVDSTILDQVYRNVCFEILKLMEMEIRQKVSSEEQMEQHKQVLQSKIDRQWATIVDEINKKKWKRKRKEEMQVQARQIWTLKASTFSTSHLSPASLSPLVFHLQSSRIMMATAVGVEGNMRILANEFGESETPAMVAYSPNKTLIYGTEAVSTISGPCTGSIDTLVWSIAYFFISSNLTWKRTLSIQGKEFPVSSEFLLAFLLGKLKLAAEAEMKCRYITTVIAIPFWLSSPTRLQIKQAATVAGFSEVYLVNEASAAAFNFVVTDKRALRCAEILIISENMDRLDVFVYSYSKAEQKVKMLANSSNYGINHWDTTSGLFKSIKRGISAHFETFQYKPTEQEKMVSDVRQACKYALELAGQELRQGSKLDPHECLYILENKTKWEYVLEKGSQDFGRRSCSVDGNKAVLVGAVRLSKSPKEIGSLIRDKMAYDVLRTGQVGDPTVRIISTNDSLPITSRKWSSSWPEKEEMATFFQNALETVHEIGRLKVNGIRDAENLEPCLEVTHEAIVSLGSVRVLSKLTQIPRYVPHDCIQWSTPNMSTSQLEALSNQVALAVKDSALIQAKAYLIQRCQEMTEKANAGHYRIRSELVKNAIKEKIMYAKKVAEHPGSTCLKVILAQLEALEKIEQTYKIIS